MITPNTFLQFLFVGRLLYDKGILEYVTAAKTVKSTFPSAQFVVVGALDNNNPSGIPERLLKNWQTTGIIEYRGAMKDIRPAIGQADVLVLPSYREGLPRVMLEGMSMAKPLITTNVAGCRETVIPNKNGYLVPSKDAFALAGAMKKMIQVGSIERQQMGQIGRQMALQKFDERKIIRTYLNLIDTY